jgi:hypothetical protein
MQPQPVMQASAMMGSPSVGQLLMVLRDSVLPSEREMAVDSLARCDWRNQPAIVESLMKAAKLDPAATVRAACVRTLARLKVNTVPVVAAISSLRNDPDIRVRNEVEQALAVLMR